MATIKEGNLIRDIRKSPAKIRKFKKSEYEFIISRYLHYTLKALLKGIPVRLCPHFWIYPSFIKYADIPERLRKYFTYSQRIFGYVFLPSISSDFLEKRSYNYKPDQSMLSAMKDMSETDDVYILTGK